MLIVADIFCLFYYLFSFAQTAPCVIKLIKTKKSDDYSLLNRLFQYIAQGCFITYLCMTTNWATSGYLVIIGFIDIILLTLENILILKYHSKFRKGKNNNDVL